MENHVKLEIAIQLIAEKIAGILKLIDSAESEELLAQYNEELELAFVEKERIALGDIEAINKILEERKKA